MKLVYVFNYFDSEGYVCRVPEFLAKFLCRKVNRKWDYAPTPEGY